MKFSANFRTGRLGTAEFNQKWQMEILAPKTGSNCGWPAHGKRPWQPISLDTLEYKNIDLRIIGRK